MFLRSCCLAAELYLLAVQEHHRPPIPPPHCWLILWTPPPCIKHKQIQIATKQSCSAVICLWGMGCSSFDHNVLHCNTESAHAAAAAADQPRCCHCCQHVSGPLHLQHADAGACSNGATFNSITLPSMTLLVAGNVLPLSRLLLSNAAAANPLTYSVTAVGDSKTFNFQAWYANQL